MKEKPVDVIAQMTTNISLSCYNTINIMRPMFDYVDDAGNVRIPAQEYRSLIDLLTTDAIPVTQHEKLQESIYARSQYRRLLLDLMVYTQIGIGEKLPFMVDDMEVGIIASGKVMGGVMRILKNWYDTVPVADIKSLVDSTGKSVIYLHPDRFMHQLIKPNEVLTPYEMYLYCKAGDALISVWTHLMLNRGCSRGNSLLIEDDNGEGLYEFRFELCDEESLTGNTTNANHYELHPRMRFNEYYLQ